MESPMPGPFHSTSFPDAFVTQAVQQCYSAASLSHVGFPSSSGVFSTEKLYKLGVRPVPRVAGGDVARAPDLVASVSLPVRYLPLGRLTRGPEPEPPAVLAYADGLLPTGGFLQSGSVVKSTGPPPDGAWRDGLVPPLGHLVSELSGRFRPSPQLMFPTSSQGKLPHFPVVCHSCMASLAWSPPSPFTTCPSCYLSSFMSLRGIYPMSLPVGTSDIGVFRAPCIIPWGPADGVASSCISFPLLSVADYRWDSVRVHPGIPPLVLVCRFSWPIAILPVRQASFIRFLLLSRWEKSFSLLSFNECDVSASLVAICLSSPPES